MFGIFWVLRIDGPDRFPVRVYRDGKLHDGETMENQINGPTCDSTDTLPGLVELPTDIRPGDYLEIGKIGAYSIGGRTEYNGFYSERIVTIMSPSETPPMT
jgi:ornithine decarboxylase